MINHTGKNMRGWGYTVFVKVTSGMDVVMKIEGTATDRRGDRGDVPVKTIEIIKVTVK
jgi:peptidyl-prolyl cis-trans isomerase B (cyclophilin B)